MCLFKNLVTLVLAININSGWRIVVLRVVYK